MTSFSNITLTSTFWMSAILEHCYSTVSFAIMFIFIQKHLLSLAGTVRLFFRSRTNYISEHLTRHIPFHVIRSSAAVKSLRSFTNIQTYFPMMAETVELRRLKSRWPNLLTFTQLYLLTSAETALLHFSSYDVFCVPVTSQPELFKFKSICVHERFCANFLQT